MVIKKIYKATLWVQGVYSLLTALWGLIDIDSFMRVTGPKTDIWLVKTVSVLLVAISIVLLTQIFRNSDPLPVILLALLTAIGLAYIDFYYSGNEVISQVYTIDGIAQVMFAIIWLIVLLYSNTVEGRKKG